VDRSLSRNGKKSFKKCLDSDPDVPDDFQSVIIHSTPQRFVQWLFNVKLLTYRQTNNQMPGKA